MNNRTRTLGAVGLAIVIVGTAVYVRNQAPADNTGSLVVSSAPARTYIPVSDVDGDGISDWEQELNTKILAQLDELDESSNEYKKPDTVTGQFAETFFENYVRSSMSGQLTSDTHTQFLSASVQPLEFESLDTFITYQDITLGVDGLDEWREYGNKVAEVVMTHTIDNENEAIILQRALNSDNPEILKELEPISAAYGNMLRDTMALQVPPALRKEHVDILNVYKALQNDINGFTAAFDDPLYALVRIKRYQDDATALFLVYRNLDEHLYQLGVRYSQEEPGGTFRQFILNQ